MKILKGDLIEFICNGKFDVIIHGCNCFCSMDAGIAQTIKSTFPEVYEADLSTIKGDKSKLGSLSFTKCHKNGFDFIIVNAYTQYHWKPQKNNIDYSAFNSVFSKIKKQFSGKRIGFPMIGAGLGGGDWEIISSIINTELENENYTLVLL